MAAEIERKFRLDAEPEWLGDCRSRQIAQGYLVLSDDAEARVRMIDGGREVKLTVKRGHGRDREETEIELHADQAEALWPATEGRRIHKRRYRAERDADSFEIDVYEGELAGLIVCEVEFGDEFSAESFEPPEWVGLELTGDQRYENRSLATTGLPGDGSSGD